MMSFTALRKKIETIFTCESNRLWMRIFRLASVSRPSVIRVGQIFTHTRANVYSESHSRPRLKDSFNFHVDHLMTTEVGQKG